MSKTPAEPRTREQRNEHSFVIKKIVQKRSVSKKGSSFKTNIIRKGHSSIKNRKVPSTNDFFKILDQVNNATPCRINVKESSEIIPVPVISKPPKVCEPSSFTINTLNAKTERYCLREVMKLSGWKESQNTNEGDMIWFVNTLREIDLKVLNYKTCYFNKYPRANVICRKRQFAILMRRFQRYFPYEYDFVPYTLILPDEYKFVKRHMSHKADKPMIAKPSRGKGGEGIFFVKNYKEIKLEESRDTELVLQDYIENPLLIDDKKFDFRMYLLISGVDTMKAYLAFEGMARFCTEDYCLPALKNNNEEESKDNLMGHLTNYSLNKTSSKYKLRENFMNSNDGNKRLLSSMFNTLKIVKGVDIEDLKSELKDIATKIVFALQSFLINSFHNEMGIGSETNQNCFHIFGIDILLDQKHKPWLLEINCFPSFSIFQEITEIDPVDGTEHKTRRVSEFDKYLKSLILKDAIEIIKDKEIPQGNVFEQVFPPQEFENEYKDLSTWMVKKYCKYKVNQFCFKCS